MSIKIEQVVLHFIQKKFIKLFLLLIYMSLVIHSVYYIKSIYLLKLAQFAFCVMGKKEKINQSNFIQKINKSQLRVRFTSCWREEVNSSQLFFQYFGYYSVKNYIIYIEYVNNFISNWVKCKLHRLTYITLFLC